MKRSLVSAIAFTSLLAVLPFVVGCFTEKDRSDERAGLDPVAPAKPADSGAAQSKQRFVQPGAVLPAAPAGDQGPDTSTQAEREALVEGNTEFALELYRRLAEKSKGGNVVFSPYSVSAALAMAYAGARGETAEQMAKVLRFPLSQERLHPAFAGVERRLRAVKGKEKAKLRTANALWGQSDFPFEDAFLRLTTRFYGAGLGQVDFRRDHEGARNAINGWVADKTQDKITELLKPGMVRPSTRLVLTNAIYFRAPWENPFPEGRSYKGDFLAREEKSVRLRMMRQQAQVPYAEGDGWQVIELPYQDSHLSMVIVLPRLLGGLEALERRMTSARLQMMLIQVEKRLVAIDLPAFTTRTVVQLEDELARMGMSLAFRNGADFSGITSKGSLVLTAVVHEACLDVREDGAEAAAATAVVMGGRSSASKPTRFTADRPFMFLIRDRVDGSVLFIGRVTDPGT